MWQKPYRPNNAISQTFNDGIVNIFSAEDISKPGYAPKVKLSPKISLRYEERKLGIKRYYSAQQNQIKVERVIRVPRAGNISSQDIAILPDSPTYRIDLVQLVPDVYPSSLDLTLVKFEQEVEL